jgi:hypothetical protein
MIKIFYECTRKEIDSLTDREHIPAELNKTFQIPKMARIHSKSSTIIYVVNQISAQ